MKLYLFLLLGVYILCTGCSEQSASDSQPKSGHTALGTSAPPAVNPVRTDSLKYLTQYIGQYPDSVGLWETEPLRTKLEELLKRDLTQFLQLMQESTPLRRERVLYTIGKSSDTENSAFLLVDVENNNLHVSIIEKGIRRQFQTSGEEPYIPYEIEQHL